MENVIRIEDVVGEIEFNEVDGEYCFTAEQIARGLGYSDADSVNTLVQRNLEEIEPFRFSDTSGVNPKGGRPRHLYTEEGAYLISMYAQTPKAREFRVRVAKLLKMLRQRQMDNIKKVLLERYPLWQKILRYKGLGLNHGEIGFLVHKEVSTVRKHVRQMESCGLLTPPKNLPALQLCVEHFKNRLN
ncbi:MAG: BRO family protein [Candidatus Brocadia sp.]|nr:BRO family protein [Candidatus Brocadia sp.]